MSIFYGSFGISAEDFIKPKIFAAGVLFLVFLGVPLATVARQIGLFGLRSKGGNYHVSLSPLSIDFVICCDFVFASLCLRMAAFPLFDPLEAVPESLPGLYWLLGTVAVLMACNVAQWRWARVGFRVALPLALVPAVFEAVIVAKYFTRQFLLQAGWFWLAGVLFVVIRRAWTGSARLNFDWERQLFSIPLLLLVFSVFVYGHIRAQFLGGAPVPVQLHLLRDTDYAPQGLAEGFLLDDSSRGFYVLHTANDKKAYLIPHEAVGDIVFGAQKAKP